MRGPAREVLHQQPAWRERADYVIAVELPRDSGADTEQLWARRVDERRFEVCCIPFFVYDIALGDVVEVDDAYLVQRVVESSGRFVFRVWFGDSSHPRDEIVAGLLDFGAVLEWSSPNLLAVDAANEGMAVEVSGWLLEQEDKGRLVFETGRSA